MSLDLDPVEKLKEAREYAEANNATEFLLVRQNRTDPDVRKLPMGAEVQQQVADTLARDLDTHIDSLRDGKTIARELDVSNTISKESIMQCAPVSHLPDSDLFNILISRDEYDTTTYTEDPKPSFQMTRISEPEGKVLAGVQSYNGVKLVETSDRLSLFYDNEEYEQFRGDLLVIKQNFTAFYFDGWLFVISPKQFESLFNMREEYEERAKDVIQSFEEEGILFDDDEKVNGWLLSQINMLRGMYGIYDEGIHEEATPEQIEEIITTHRLDDRYSLEYTRQNGSIVLDVDEYQDTWMLLRLLSGKYADDNIMGYKWEIDSGRRT